MRKSIVLAAGSFSVLAGTAFAAPAVTAPPIGVVNGSYNVPVFTDSLDTGVNFTTITSAANGSAAIDASAQFGFDYAAGGPIGPGGVITVPAGRIPEARPGSGTVGLVMTANDVDDTGTDATQAVAARLNAAVPLGGRSQFAIRFNMWANYVGATNTSEFAAFGLGASNAQTSIGALATGATGTTPATATAGTGPITSGYTFTVTGDGGFARDLRAFVGSAEDLDANQDRFYAAPLGSGSAATFQPSQDAGNAYNAQAYNTTSGAATANIPGNRWLDVTLFYDGTNLFYYLNGLPIYTRAVSNLTPEGAFLGYADFTASVSPGSAQTFAVYDNFSVAVPEPTSLAALAGAATMLLRRRK